MVNQLLRSTGLSKAVWVRSWYEQHLRKQKNNSIWLARDVLIGLKISLNPNQWNKYFQEELDLVQGFPNWQVPRGNWGATDMLYWAEAHFLGHSQPALIYSDIKVLWSCGTWKCVMMSLRHLHFGFSDQQCKEQGVAGPVSFGSTEQVDVFKYCLLVTKNSAF